MARSTAPEDMVKEFEEWLPRELVGLYAALWDEVASLNVGWNSYIDLYGSGEDRIDLLNHTASSFFNYLESALLGDTLLSLVRLTDPPKSAGLRNLTFQRLAGKLQFLGDSELARKVEVALAPLLQAVEPIRDYRNEWLTYRDLKICLNSDPHGWGFTREDVDRSVDLANGILNVVNMDIRRSETRFDMVIERGGADHLVFALEQARAAEAKSRETSFRVSEVPLQS